jgi:NADPH-dependent ferric siderophore reductase
MVETQDQRVERVMHELRPRIVEVSAVEDITPRYRRITFTGPELDGFVSLAPADHIKLLVSLDPERAPMPPKRGPQGMEKAADAPPQVMRDFTPRRYDADTQTLEIDFVLHGSGPVADWASAAAPGQKVGVLGPRGSKVVKAEAFDWLLMIGDETMLPAIARQVEELPDGARLIAYIEVDGPQDEQQLTTNGNVKLHWVQRNGAEPGATTVLLDAVKAAEFPEGEVFVWAGGEAGILKLIRRHLLDDRGIEKECCGITGHWKRGETDFDHHAPLDTDD